MIKKEKSDDPQSMQEYVKLMTEHQWAIRGFLPSLMPGSPNVGDVLQETNLVLWQKHKQFKLGTNFLARVSRIARYEVMRHRDRIRRQKDFLKIKSHRDDHDKKPSTPFLTAISLCLIALSGPASATLLAYYSFDEDFTDGSGNANNLTSAGGGSPLITTAALAPSEVKFGAGALSLDHTANEWLSMTTELNFKLTDAWSVSFWAKQSATSLLNNSTGMVMGDNTTAASFIWNTSNNGQVTGGNGTGGLRFRPASGGVGAGNNNYAVGTDTNYNHVVMVADGTGKLTVYYNNGSPIVTAAASGGTIFDINAIGRAYSSNGFTFGGQLDEIYIYDEAIDAAKVNHLYTNTLGPDTTSPTLVDIVDDRAGGPVEPESTVTYTVSFNEDMDDSTVAATDFGNAGSAPTFTIGTITETSPGVFTVPVTPTSMGTLRLQINQSAILSDPADNDLDTSAALLDDTTILIEIDNTDPTLATGDIEDDQGAGPVTQGTTVTYTLTFSEDIDDSTVDAGGFGNAGTATFTIGAITEVSPGVFEVEITPDSAGTLQLKVLSGAEITDAAGNLLDTSDDIVSETLITVLEGFSPAGVRRLRVVLVGGQSNADGRAAPSGLPTSPVNLQLPQEDVDFFYRVEDTIYPRTTLRPGKSETGGFGPAITCGRHLADELADGNTTRIAVIKYANGGTNLHTHWAAGGDNTTSSDGTQYVRFQQTVTAGLATLSSTYPNAVIELVGMIWLQGESDAGTEAVNYETNLTNFIADVRLTYGADLRFVVIRLSDNQTGVGATLSTIQNAQTAVAAAHPLTALVDTNGLAMQDSLHFNPASQQQIGHASAIQLLNLYPFLTPPAIAPLQNGDFKITVGHAFEGFLYTLKASLTLQAGDWQIVDSETAAGSTVVFNISPAPEETRRFFRVERTLEP